MARTIQNRKRSRPWSGGRMFSKRRRFVKRRKYGSKFTTTQTKPYSFSMNRKLTKRKIKSYKNALWMVSSVMPKYRVSGSAARVVTTPVDVISYQASVFQLFQDPVSVFVTNNWISDRGSTGVVSLSDSIICRGGMLNFTISHENPETIEYEVLYVKSRPGFTGAGPLSNVTVKSDNPAMGDVPSNGFVITKRFTGLLAPSTAMKFNYKIKLQRIDIDAATNGFNQFYVVVKVGNTVSSVAQGVTVVCSSVVYVCTDAH